MKFIDIAPFHRGAFTLIEILVGISIISIIALGSTQVNFTRLSQKQQLSIGAIDIISKIESVRDAAITGKGFGNPLITPKSWKIEMSQAGSGILLASYETGVFTLFSPLSWNSDKKIYLKNIYCEKFDGSTQLLSGTGTLTFVKDRIVLSGCSDAYYKKLVLHISLLGFTEIIEINSINGVVLKR